jgi:hypothetical protein
MLCMLCLLSSVVFVPGLINSIINIYSRGIQSHWSTLNKPPAHVGMRPRRSGPCGNLFFGRAKRVSHLADLTSAWEICAGNQALEEYSEFGYIHWRRK